MEVGMSQALSREVVTVSDVAKALEVCNRKVRRMIEKGELEECRLGWRYEIPVESLRKWIFRTLGMHGAARICRQAERNQEISLEKMGHSSSLAWFYIQKQTRALRESLESQSQNNREHNETAPNELEPGEAVVRLKPLMRKLAVRFGGRDAWLRDDLFQEMALAILECEGRNCVKYYADRMESRALAAGVPARDCVCGSVAVGGVCEDGSGGGLCEGGGVVRSGAVAVVDAGVVWGVVGGGGAVGGVRGGELMRMVARSH